MDEEIKKKIEMAKFHQKIIDDLEYIKKQTTDTNGRVSGLEEKMIEAQNNIAEAFRRLSGVDSIALKFKSDAEQSKDDLIKELKRKVDSHRRIEEKRNERISWIIVSSLLFILGVLGIINADFIKAII